MQKIVCDPVSPTLLKICRGYAAVRIAGRSRCIRRRLDFRRAPVLPFLRWAGGKQWLARIASNLIPTCTGAYYEPFLGAANIFLAIKPQFAVLADINEELITTYQAIKDDVETVIAELRCYHSNKCAYMRARRNRPRVPARIAARFIYLNKTAWNGLYRLNPQGQFNVPYGGKRNLVICPEERLRAVAKALRSITLISGDFETATASARYNDLVYFDPPYITSHANNGFVSYNAHLFDWDDQCRLAKHARTLVTRGAHVIMSNADHQPLLKLFQGFYYYRIERNSLIGGWKGTRGRRVEALVSSIVLGDIPTVKV